MRVVRAFLFCGTAALCLSAQSSAPSSANQAPAAASPTAAQTPAPAAQPVGQANTAPVTALPAPAAKQPQAKSADQGTPEPATVLKVITRLVLIDAVVTDNKGVPVVDLKPSDIEILENGKPQALRVASLHRADPNKTTVAGIPKLPPGRFTNIPLYRPDDDPPTVLLLDALNTPFADQAYARSQMVKYIKTLQPGRRVAVYLLGSKLEMLQDFTTDPSLLLQAVNRKKNAQSSRLIDENPDPIGSSMPDGSENSTDALTRMEAQIADFEEEETRFRTDQRVRETMAALQAISRNLAGYVGRKNLVWVGAGFPLNIGIDDPIGSTTTQRDYSDMVHRTATTLTDAQVSIYPVDARGLVADLLGGASVSGRNRMGRVPTGSEFGQQLSRASTALFDVHTAMNRIADETGGKAYYNRNDIDKAIASSIIDGSTYYTLGYYPDDKNWDGKFRRIEVKVHRPGLHVRSRQGYYATDPAGSTAVNSPEARHEFVAAMALDNPEATMLPFYAQLTPKGDQTFVNFLVDPNAVHFTPQEDREHGNLDFAIAVFDAHRKLVTSDGQTLDMPLKPETYKKLLQNGIPFEHALKLAPGKYTVKLGVRDNQTGLIGTITAHVEVPAAS